MRVIRLKPVHHGAEHITQPDDRGIHEPGDLVRPVEQIGHRLRAQDRSPDRHERRCPATHPSGAPSREAAAWLGLRPGGDLGTNPPQTIGTGLDGINNAQRVPEGALEASLAGIRAAVAHASRSSTERSADIAREVWLLTAPLVIFIASAI